MTSGNARFPMISRICAAQRACSGPSPPASRAVPGGDGISRLRIRAIWRTRWWFVAHNELTFIRRSVEPRVLRCADAAALKECPPDEPRGPQRDDHRHGRVRTAPGKSAAPSVWCGDAGHAARKTRKPCRAGWRPFAHRSHGLGTRRRHLSTPELSAAPCGGRGRVRVRPLAHEAGAVCVRMEPMPDRRRRKGSSTPWQRTNGVQQMVRRRWKPGSSRRSTS